MVEPLTDEMEDKLSPVKRENLNEKLVQQIKALIFSKGVKPGFKLPSERVLTQQFQVSRAVVRQALKSLEQSGLVEIRTGAMGGAFVADNLHIPLLHAAYDLLNSGRLTISHFCDARMAIECSGVRLAAQNGTTAEVEDLRTLNRKMLDSLKEPTNRRIEELRKGNNAFHLAIAAMSGNPLIQLIIQSILDLQSALYMKRSRMKSYKLMKDTYERHEAIIQALEARDSVRSEELMALDTGAIQSIVTSQKKSTGRH
jgi:DNA-binding FadR family transcriptional regulator